MTNYVSILALLVSCFSLGYISGKHSNEGIIEQYKDFANKFRDAAFEAQRQAELALEKCK